MRLYRLALGFIVILLVVGLAVARQEVVSANGGAAQMIAEHNATVMSMQVVVTVVLTPTPRPTPVQMFVPDGSTSAGNYGTLWHKDRPDADVLIISNKHDEYPSGEAQVAEWIAKGEACLSESGARFYATGSDPKDNERGVGVRMMSGRCAEYVGWVDMSVLNFRYGVVPIQTEPPTNGG